MSIWHHSSCVAQAPSPLTLYCWFQVVTIDRERPEGARLPKEAMLLRDIFKFTKPSLDAFPPFGLISRACQRPRSPPIALTLTFIKQTNT